MDDELIMVYDAHGCGKPCSFCDHDAIGEIEFKFPDIKKIASLWICANHRLALEAGLRAHRKWMIRGGKEEVATKLQQSVSSKMKRQRNPRR